MSVSLKFEIRLMRKEDYNQVLSLLINSFFPDEPLTRCLQVTDTLEYSKNMIDFFLQEQYSFVAYDTETNHIVALYLNEIIHENAQQEINEADEKLRFILQLHANIHKKWNIFERLNADTLLHLCIINVEKIARGHGLASGLIDVIL